MDYAVENRLDMALTGSKRRRMKIQD